MNSKIKKILETLENSGYEAYIVGGYVRDTLLKIKTTDIDICTNALPKDIIKIFNTKGTNITYGAITLNDGKYNFDITTYRTESNYDKRVPLNIEYVDDLLLDLKRRDFTINSLCMDKKGNIIDLLNATKDLNNKLIKSIGNTNIKLTEDPLRILRALRFKVILNFELDEEIKTFIKENKGLIKTLSYTRKKEELNRMFASNKAKDALNLLKEYNLLDELEINFTEIKNTNDILGVWAQLDYSDNYNFSKSSKDIINKIREIIKLNKIDNDILYKYGLYISMVAGEILNLNPKEINKRYANLKIKTITDLNIKSEDILKIKPSYKINEITKDLIKKINNNELNNNYKDIKKYIINKWK